MTDSHVEVYVHMVWSTWDRRPMLDRRTAKAVRTAVAAKAEGLGCQMLALGGVSDHVHVLVRMPATRTIAEVAHAVKGSSSHLITHMPDGDPAFKWQGGYAAISVGPRHVPAVVAYIKAQAAHHRDNSLDPELEIA
ncbi:MAG: IS200/IS605 family transposase [Armatimonadetes bacterium]|nr:IS200/IS605 family transposase [Armatimonadota bacterium]